MSVILRRCISGTKAFDPQQSSLRLSPLNLCVRKIAAQSNRLALIAGFEHDAVKGRLIVGIQITEVVQIDVADFSLHEVWAKIEVGRSHRCIGC